MYAIIKTGGKQYRVSEGDKIKVEQLDQEKGASFDISEVLFVGGDKTQIGKPFVAGATVTVEVARQLRDKKIRVFKKKRRKGYRKAQGHRQNLTELVVKKISC
ncbi:MAG: 50S ribosomal protein L21 [Bdellovibrionota bacterium]|nr:50S ribosomal protein L21 [Pseudobdellovibrionaceae bacterium]MEC9282437.1 50S ribosomal protein L21 [Bdellovibrionota bacterium]|tara:strand:- start:9824 stop:10132 length:309 start_codon:yes stop_codon:yes gene_type:complete